MKSICWGILAVLACSCTVCWGRDYRVPAGNSASNIQVVINRCRVGDRIILGDGIYLGQIRIDRAITLAGQNPESTILDGGGTGPVVQVTCQGVVRISNCTIRNGVVVGGLDEDVRGGGICNGQATLYLVNVDIQSNAVWGGVVAGVSSGDVLGGGVFSGGRLDLRNCSFTRNEAHNEVACPAGGMALGGAVYASRGLCINRCVFISNYCEGGGYPDRQLAAGAACYVVGSHAIVVETAFDGNFVDGRGLTGKGGAYAQVDGYASFRGCDFNANSTLRGGALYNSGITMVDACHFASNQANEGGSVLNEGHLSISRSAFEANTALNGGCIFNSGTVNLTDSCLTNNYGSFVNMTYQPGSLGGCVLNSGTTRVDRCLFACNAAETGGAVYNQSVLSVIDSTFQGNRADAGGGVHNGSGGVLYLERTRFDGNVTHGRTKGAGGHGPSSPIHGLGGAVFNVSTASVWDCVFEGNLAIGVGCYGGIGGGFGGAVLNAGSLAIDRSTFHSNSVVGHLGSSSLTLAGGGAICNRGSMALSNSTLSANRGQNDVPAEWYPTVLDGGAITSPGTSVISHCTFVSNSLVPVGAVPEHIYGASISAPGLVSIGNSVVADSTTEVARSCWGSFSSMGWNIFEATNDMNFVTTHPTDRLNVQARLGPTVTVHQGQRACLPLAGSPVIDGGSKASAEYDQRGLRRPRDVVGYPNTGDGSDIGAVEMCNYDVALNLQRLESEPDGSQWRITLNNVGLRQVRQVIVVVLLPESSSLVSCTPARVIRSWKRLVFLDVGALPAAQELDIDLVLEGTAVPISPSGEISASAYCSPGDDFSANNTMTVLAW